MINKYERIESSNDCVSKYVFTNKESTVVAESVLYKYESYEERTVICCSVQSGCPVGCKFCGTGSNFIRNLTENEIIYQITTILKDVNLIDKVNDIKKFQIMFMSMGEPMLNWPNVEAAITKLNELFPNASLLISTVGIDDDDVFSEIIQLSKRNNKIGIQFSIHKSTDDERDVLIPFKKKMDLFKIRDVATLWWKETGRQPYLNYCVDGNNNTYTDYLNLRSLFSPVVFNFTFSVICSKDEKASSLKYDNTDKISDFQALFVKTGYNTRLFNPEGQDDIGGGCGQLWYVQRLLNQNKNEYAKLEAIL